MNNEIVEAYFHAKNTFDELEFVMNERLGKVIQLIHFFYGVRLNGWANSEAEDNPYNTGSPNLTDDGEHIGIVVYGIDFDNNKNDELMRNKIDFNNEIPVKFLTMSDDDILKELKHNSAYSNDQVNPEDY